MVGVRHIPQADAGGFQRDAAACGVLNDRLVGGFQLFDGVVARNVGDPGDAAQRAVLRTAWSM